MAINIRDEIAKVESHDPTLSVEGVTELVLLHL